MFVPNYATLTGLIKTMGSSIPRVVRDARTTLGYDMQRFQRKKTVA
jgi:hypothetical protein